MQIVRPPLPTVFRALLVLLPGVGCRGSIQRLDGGGFFVKKVELQNADLNNSLFSIIRRPAEIPPANQTLPVKKGAIIDSDLSAQPTVAGSDGKPSHGCIVLLLQISPLSSGSTKRLKSDLSMYGCGPAGAFL